MAAAQDDLSLHKANKQRLQANPRAIHIVEDTDRRTMQAFTAATKEECPPRHQGSKHMLGKLNKAAVEGRVENLSNTEIVPNLPHPQTRSKTERRNNPDGTQEELEQEWRQAPAHADDWQEQMRVFYTTLMMAISVHQEHTKLHVQWLDLKEFYEKFLFGPTIMKRNVPPSLAKLMLAERRAWQEIITLMWERDHTLGEALLKVRNDTLWWTNELEARRSDRGAPREQYQRPPPPQHNRGKGKPYPPQPQRQVQQWQQKPQPPAKGKGKNKGKTKKGPRNDMHQRDAPKSLPSSKARLPVSQWGDPPYKAEWCINFHLGRPCTVQPCNRDHTQAATGASTPLCSARPLDSLPPTSPRPSKRTNDTHKPPVCAAPTQLSQYPVNKLGKELSLIRQLWACAAPTQLSQYPVNELGKEISLTLRLRACAAPPNSRSTR